MANFTTENNTYCFELDPLFLIRLSSSTFGTLRNDDDANENVRK